MPFETCQRALQTSSTHPVTCWPRPYLRFNLQQNQVPEGAGPGGCPQQSTAGQVLILRAAEARKATAEVLVKLLGLSFYFQKLKVRETWRRW
jgi:hypothetical protein